jgi:hydrogenase expression/formation protein HypD
MKPPRIQDAQAQMTAAVETLGRPIQIMEVCGTHTVAIFRQGIRSLLPEGIRLLSGPGCPVCVTDQGTIDAILQLAQREDTIIATYGDMIRVPGTDTSLEKLHQTNIRVVLSADDAVDLAVKYPDKTVVFAAVGFETTTPATAVAVQTAHQKGIGNFCILCCHKLVVPAMHALLGGHNDKIDAFLCPGHVSVIIGWQAYQSVVEEYGRPCVVAGFEPMQILEGIARICRQIQTGRRQVESVYQAAVRPQGNPIALKLMDKFFQPWDGPWRGLGIIPGGSLRLRKEYETFDAAVRFHILPKESPEPAGCLCGKVLCGLIEPPLCALFGKRCTPDHPVGPCMVSAEGACSAWYKYKAQ